MQGFPETTFPIPVPDDAVVLEGAYLVERAADAGLRIEALYCVPARETWARALTGSTRTSRDARICTLHESALSEVAGYRFHRGVIGFAARSAAAGRAVFNAPERTDHSGAGIILVLPETTDPGNVGALFRNAAAFACDGILLGSRCPDPLSRRVLRVSMGSSLSLPWGRITSPGELASNASGYVPVAAVLDSPAIPVRSFRAPDAIALLLGNESTGITDEWTALAVHRITIPLGRTVDSLNVATAGAILLYELGRSRTGKESSVRIY